MFTRMSYFNDIQIKYFLNGLASTVHATSLEVLNDFGSHYVTSAYKCQSFNVDSYNDIHYRSFSIFFNIKKSYYYKTSLLFSG